MARDGIEPPTPAFSGLDSPNAIVIKIQHLDHFDRLKSLLFWDSNGTEEWDNNPGRSNLPSPFHNPRSIAERLLSKSEKDFKGACRMSAIK